MTSFSLQMHLLRYNTHHYKKFKLKDKASKHVQVSKKCKFTWKNKKDVAAAAAAQALGQVNFKFSILCILWKIDNKNTNKKMFNGWK